jgi:KilA-N domain
MAIQLITAHYGTMSVLFQTDAFINATAIAKQFNKRPNDWLNLASTKEYMACLLEFQLPEKMVNEQNQLVITKTGQAENGGGTWLHPKLAIPFARWLDVRFAAWCDLQIEKILRSHANPDSFSEFLKPITEPITLEDFNWRHQVLTNAWQNLQNAQVVITLSGSELLVGKRLAKSKRLF